MGKSVLRKRTWRQAEVLLMRQHYENLGDDAMKAILPGRTLYGIRGKARELGLRAPKEQAWSLPAAPSLTEALLTNKHKHAAGVIPIRGSW
jgi:hypothetical protein